MLYILLLTLFLIGGHECRSKNPASIAKDNEISATYNKTLRNACGGAPCEHCCMVVSGNYKCGCQEGFRLQNNLCYRLNCGVPNPFHGYGTIEATDQWKLDSQAVYRCQKPYTLTGDFYRTCQGRPSDTGWEDFTSATSCLDYCLDVDLSGQPRCGTDHHSGATCLKKGCCYDINTMTCRHKPVKAYVRYTNEKSVSSALLTLPKHNQETCQHECNFNVDCKAFSLKRTILTSGFVDITCYLHGQSRGEMLDAGLVSDDPDYDVYHIIEKDQNSDTIEESNQRVTTQIFEGCYKDSPSHPDLPFPIARDDKKMSVIKCLQLCRKQNFHFAGLQNGTHCNCGNTMARRHGLSDNCNSACAGDEQVTCGDLHTNAVYRLNMDPRYLGCHTDHDGNRDLPFAVSTGSKISASQCIHQCFQNNYKYAGVQDGGSCFCGNRYGKYGGAVEFLCGRPCGVHGRQNCGGDMVNAVYTTERAYDASRILDPTATKIFSDVGQMTGIDPQTFVAFKGMKTFVSRRLVLHSAHPIVHVGEEPTCANDCHKPCGNIENEAGYSHLGDDVILRWFHFRLSDLPLYVGTNPRRVYIYAQTLVIDTDIDVGYALHIRATQILLDGEATRLMQVAPTAADLGNDLDLTKAQGPYPDLTYQKQSFMCARILIETKEQVNLNVAFDILNEMIVSPCGGEEQCSFAGTVRSYTSLMTGIDRSQVHFVPTYTKDHLLDMLDIYHSQITIYKYITDKLFNEVLTDTEFIDYTEQASGIYTATDIEQARVEKDKAVADIAGAQDVYANIEGFYNASLLELDSSAKTFEKGVEEAANSGLVKGLVGFVKGCATAVYGIYSSDLTAIVDGVGDMFQGAKDIGQVLQEINQIVRKMWDMTAHALELMAKLQDMTQNFDAATYMEDVEEMTSLKASVIEWRNLKNQAYVILHDDQVQDISGSEPYSNAILSTANLGEAMSEAMIERAELSRYAIEKRAILDAKLKQRERVEQLIEDLRNGVAVKEQTLAAIHEQTYDVRIDLNDALLRFCQAYFYETHRECSNKTRPQFGGGLGDLLQKIQAARNDSMFEENVAPSIEIEVILSDSDLDVNCSDYTVCPVNYLRNHRFINYHLSEDHPAFSGYERCRIQEIILKTPGAASPIENKNLMFRIEASGNFFGRYDGQVFAFITRPISLGFRYDVISDHISIRADIYDPYQGVFNHMTPFTTWHISVHENYPHIDLSQVKTIHMTVIGSCMKTTS